MSLTAGRASLTRCMKLLIGHGSHGGSREPFLCRVARFVSSSLVETGESDRIRSVKK